MGRCPDCGYFCTLPLGLWNDTLSGLSSSDVWVLAGHPQQEHETSHGSMSKTKWAVDGPDGTVLEVDGRKFGTNDDGAPMLCSMYCRSMGRHAHIEWCRSDNPRTCGGPELEHIRTAMQPHPQKAKDWISHSLYWKRTGTSLCGTRVIGPILSPLLDDRFQRYPGASPIPSDI